MSGLAQSAGVPVTRRQLRAVERGEAPAPVAWKFPAGDEQPTEKIPRPPHPTRRELRSQPAPKGRVARRVAVPRAVILVALGVVTVAAPVLGLDGTDHSAHAHPISPAIAAVTPAPSPDATAGDTLEALPLLGPQVVSPGAGQSGPDLSSRAVERAPVETPTPAPAPPVETAAAPAPEPVAPTVVMPLAAGSFRQTSPYGGRTDPINGAAAFHTGVDLAAPLDSPIYAVADGVVDYVGPGKDGRSSMIIVLKHTIDGQDVYTWYNHMYARGLYVEEGQTVTAGQVIAGVGNNGRSTGAHLHFEVHTDDDLTTTDPLAWLAQQDAVDASLLPAG